MNTDELAHRPVLLYWRPGEWRAACDACSDKAGAAVYPCKDPSAIHARKWPRTQWLTESTR